MISCTEFIPAYSTLFTYLEEKVGPEEVQRYWEHNFDPKKAPLFGFLSREGIRGCYSYWSGTLNEEAADFTMYLNEKRGFYMLDMHHCPSKGRLLKLKEDIGVEPYHGYCLHCDHYRASAEACGFHYIYNFKGTDQAACKILIYDPNVFDGRIIIDESTQIMDRRAADNEYFHLAFHNGLNKGICYLHENYGEAAVKEFLIRFAREIYAPVARAASKTGLAAIVEKIRSTYAAEHAEEAVDLRLQEKELTVTVHYCPAEKYLRSAGFDISPLYYLSTETVMETLADMCGLVFAMDHYDPAHGAAKYRFIKK